MTRQPSAPATSTPPLWRRLVRPAVLLATVLVVFGWLLPQVIDYDQVWAALTDLDAAEVLVLVVLALARVPTEALIYRAFLPGLSLRCGSEAYLSSNFAGQLLPPPGASLVQYGYFRREGFSTDAAGLAAAGSFVFPTLGRLVLPLVAVLVLAVAGDIDGSIAIVAALSLVVTAMAGVVGYVLLRTESSAQWLGAKAQRPLSRALGWMKREPVEDGLDRLRRYAPRHSQPWEGAGSWEASGWPRTWA